MLATNDSTDLDEYKEYVNTELMKVFEACSFQDITGQRISKVVKTLNHVEDRVSKLISILGITNKDGTPKDAKPILDPDAVESDADLLNGPALAGEGIDQDDVDSLMGDFDAPPQADAAPASDPKKDKATSQDDIDNLFG